MSRRASPALWAAAALAVGAFVAIWLVVLAHSQPSPIAAEGTTRLSDFAGFWAAGETANRAAPAAAWDWPAMRRLIEGATGAATVGEMPFHYAPPMQVAMQPVALLGPDLGRIVWPLLQLGFLGCVAWRIFPHPLAVIFAATSPPALISTFAGQTGALTAGLIGLALVEMDRRPRAAGAALGALILKPHVALGPAVYALFGGRWRMLAAAVGVAALLVAVSLALHGGAPWRAFFASLTSTGAMLTGAETAARFDVMVTPYGQARRFGLAAEAAWAAQGAVTLAALALTVRAWRDPETPGDLRLALAACLTAAISPRLFAYDLTAMAVGALFLMRGGAGAATQVAVTGLYIASATALVGGHAIVAAAAPAFVVFLALRRQA